MAMYLEIFQRTGVDILHRVYIEFRTKAKASLIGDCERTVETSFLKAAKLNIALFLGTKLFDLLSGLSPDRS